jgi:hypothetical protein
LRKSVEANNHPKTFLPDTWYLHKRGLLKKQAQPSVPGFWAAVRGLYAHPVSRA